jgi:mannosyltransferase
MRSRRQTAAILFVITAVAFALRAYRLNFQSLWNDELLTHLNANDPFMTVLLNSQDVNTPPLYYVIIHFLISFFDHLSVLRIPSLLFGSLSVPLFYLVLAHRFGRSVGLMGASLMVISPFHMWYSQEARPYALLLLLSMLSIWCLQHATKNGSNRWWKVAFVISTTATVYCHTLAAALIGFLVTYVAIAIPRQKWWDWLVPFASIAVLSTPVIYRLLIVPPVGTANAFEVTKPLAAIAYTLWAFGTGFSLGPNVAELHMPERASILWPYLPMILPVMLVLCFLLAFGTIQLFAKQRETFWVTILWILFPLGFALVGSIFTVHPFNVRYAILAFPAFLTLVSVGLVSIKHYGVRAFVTAMISLISLGSLTNYFFNERYHRDDNRAASQFLSVHAVPNDLVIASAAYTAPNLRYYYHGEPIKIVGYPTHNGIGEDSSFHPDPPGALFVENDYSIAADIEHIIAGRQRFWLFLSRVFHSDPYGSIPSFLDARYERKLSASWAGAQLILYETRGNGLRGSR